MSAAATLDISAVDGDDDDDDDDDDDFVCSYSSIASFVGSVITTHRVHEKTVMMVCWCPRLGLA